MKLKLFMLFIFFATLVGCDKKIDATNKDTFLESIKSIEADLPDNKYIDFSVAVDRLAIKSALTLQSRFLDENMNEEEFQQLVFEEMKKTFDGKTADELIKESKAYAKEKGW